MLDVSDLVGRPGSHRDETGEVQVSVRVGESSVEGPAHVAVRIDGVDAGVLARFEAGVQACLVCTRCLREWTEPLTVAATQVFETEPDEDGYALQGDGTIDLGPPVRDEIALSVPVRPLCRADCAGLCPTCGTDLNDEPCGGHDEPSSSPFAALRGLFDPPGE